MALILVFSVKCSMSELTKQLSFFVVIAFFIKFSSHTVVNVLIFFFNWLYYCSRDFEKASPSEKCIYI